VFDQKKDTYQGVGYVDLILTREKGLAIFKKPGFFEIRRVNSPSFSVEQAFFHVQLKPLFVRGSFFGLQVQPVTRVYLVIAWL